MHGIMAFHFRSRYKQPLIYPLLSKPAAFFIALVLIVVLSSPFKSHSQSEQLLSLPEEQPPYRCPSTHHRPVYIFLHMHKTAGNNLKQALFAFASRNNLTLYHTCHRALPDSRFVAWWLNRRKTATSLDCNLDHLRTLPLLNRSRFHFVVGHQHHGVHNLFQPRPPRYFTFLRHPIFRKTSHFLHFESPNASIAEYLISQNLNYMTKRLATRAPASELSLHFRSRAIDVDPFASRAALSAAKAHLTSNFFFVGLHHRYAESMCVLSHILNLACRNGHFKRDKASLDQLAHAFPMRPRRISRARVNVRGKTISTVSSLPSEVLKKALRAEGADMQLFHFAEQLFEAKLTQYEHCRERASFPKPEIFL